MANIKFILFLHIEFFNRHRNIFDLNIAPLKQINKQINIWEECIVCAYVLIPTMFA